MATVDSSNINVYIEVIAFALSALVVGAILVIEAISWYSDVKAEKSDDTKSHLQMMMTIEGIQVKAQSPVNTSSNGDSINASVGANPKFASSDPTGSEPVTSSGSSHTNPFLRLCTMVTYMSYLCYSITAITSKLGIGLNDRCDKRVALPSFFYMTSKSCLYLVLLYRIYFVYRNSVFQKSGKRLKVAAMFVVLWGAFISISNYILLSVETLHDEHGHVYCAQTSNEMLVLLFLVFDFLMNILCCYSFTRPLLWLSRMKRRNESPMVAIYNIVAKYVILTVVTVTSTFLCLLPLILLNIQWSPAIDVVVNSLCIMGFNKKYHRHYELLCCGAIKIGNCVIQMKCCYGAKTETKETPAPAPSK